MRKTLSNSAAIFGGEALSRLTSFVLGMVIARRFGAAGLGQYAYALAWASVLMIVPDFGLHLSATRELATEPQRLRRVFWGLARIKMVLAGGVVLFAVAMGQEFVRDEGRRLLLYVLLARVILLTFSQGVMVVFKAFERMHYIALQQFVNAIMVLACAAAALVLRADLWIVVACLAAGQAADVILGWRVARARFDVGSAGGWDWPYLRTMLVTAAPVGLTLVLQAANLRVDILALSIFAPDAEVGRFQVAGSFLVASYLFACLAITPLFPALCRLLQQPSERGSLYVASILKYGALLVTAGSLVVWLAAPRVVVYLYGARLADAAGLLRLLAPAFPLVFINTALFYVFVAARERAVYLGTLLLSLALGVVLNVTLAHSYGARGAVWADLIREFVVAMTFLYHLARRRLAIKAGNALLKAYLGSAALLLILAVLMRPWPGWTGAATALLLGGTLIFAGLPKRWEVLFIFGGGA